jgi:hypothetical protein
VCLGNKPDLIDVTPQPVFTLFIGSDDWVASFVMVAGGMFVFGIVAAAHMPALQAETKMYPDVSDLQAIFTAIGRWNHILNCGEMLAIIAAQVAGFNCFLDLAGKTYTAARIFFHVSSLYDLEYCEIVNGTGLSFI